MNNEPMTPAEFQKYEFFAKKFTEEELSYREIIPCLSLKTIVGAIAGTIYSMHPFGVVPEVSKICNEIQRVLRKNEEALHPEFSYKKIGLDFECLEHVKPADLLTFLDRELKRIPEFENLNLSLNEKRMNIKVDDPNRNQFLFTSRLSTTARENDFIDLDACIRNIYYEILLHDMEDITAPIRNMRYLNNPQIKGQMEISIEGREEKKGSPKVIVLCNSIYPHSHKELIEVETMIGAIWGFFFGTCRKTYWPQMPDDELSEKVSIICDKFEGLILSNQEEEYRAHNSKYMHFIGYDTLVELHELFMALRKIPEFYMLMKVAVADISFDDDDMLNGTIVFIANYAVLMDHEGLAMSYLIDNQHVRMDGSEKDDPKENPKRSIADPVSPLLGVKLRYVESVIAEELYRHRADCPGIKEFGMTVQDIIDEFLHFVKSNPDKDIHDYGPMGSYWRFHSWSNLVFFSEKRAVLDFLSNLCLVPQFVHLTKATKTLGSTMITRMVYHLMEIATNYPDADVPKEDESLEGVK